MKYRYKGYDIYVSDKKDKKYYAIVKNRKVYFGARGYGQYKDKLGYYKQYDNLDKEKRERYYARHKKNYPEATPDWFSKEILW